MVKRKEIKEIRDYLRENDSLVQIKGEDYIMKLVKAMEIINYYSIMILQDRPDRPVSLSDMEESEAEELEEAVDKVREFIKEMRG